MRASVFMAGGGIVRLDHGRQKAEDRKATLASVFRRLSAPDFDTGAFGRRSPLAVLPFGLSRLDGVLGGGLRRAALHEIRSGESRDAGAATGFAVAILSRLGSLEGRTDDHRRVLWIVETAAAHETGFPYAAGLGRFSLAHSRLIVVRVRKPADVLWVFEEGLRCRGLSAVLAEIRGNPRQLDLTASRRLALRAGEHGVMGLLLRQSAEVEPNAAVTRWLVTPRPAATTDDYPTGIGDPAWRLTLERNRSGTTGIFDVEWNHERGIFVAGAGPAHSLPVAALPPDRPPAPADVREGMAFARAS